MINNFNISNSSNTKSSDILGSFVVGPLEMGQGITIGNSLKRTLLSNLTGFAITGARINNLKHEFSIIEGVREDILEICLNLKEVVFKPSIFLNYKNLNESKAIPLKFKAFISIKGPMIITAGLFHLPKDLFQIVNPDKYICTLTDNSVLYLEVDIENDLSYKTNKVQMMIDSSSISKSKIISIDNVFTPIRNVNYKVKLIYDSKGNLKEALDLEILTNGSISPKRAFQEAIKILINVLYPLLTTSTSFAFLAYKDIKLNNIKKYLLNVIN